MEEYYVFVKRLVNAFENVKLDYAFTGALAVSFYGVPRTTTDVDVIIAVADETDLKRKITAALKQANLEVFQSPEGLISAKLRMIKATLPPERANKDKEDIKAILSFVKLNIIAVRKQAQKDKTLEILEALTHA